MLIMREERIRVGYVTIEEERADHKKAIIALAAMKKLEKRLKPQVVESGHAPFFQKCRAWLPKDIINQLNIVK